MTHVVHVRKQGLDAGGAAAPPPAAVSGGGGGEDGDGDGDKEGGGRAVARSVSRAASTRTLRIAAGADVDSGGGGGGGGLTSALSARRTSVSGKWAAAAVEDEGSRRGRRHSGLGQQEEPRRTSGLLASFLSGLGGRSSKVVPVRREHAHTQSYQQTQQRHCAR